jgi:hypothetical protein
VGRSVIRALAAVAALVLALVACALAVDAGRWRHVGDHPPATLLGASAERVLGTHDDVALRSGIRAFVTAVRTPYGFDNGQTQTRVRAGAEAQLAGIASAAPANEASQADDLLGVLAWGGTQSPPGVLDPADRAVQAFTEAAHLDPKNTAAAFNLELALRALAPHGTRPGSNPNAGTQGRGNSGAGSGLAGEGY